LALESLVFFKGKVDRRREEPSLRVSEIVALEQADELLSSMVVIRVPCLGSSETTLQKLRELLKTYAGDRPVYLELWTANQLKVTIRTRSVIRPTPDFCNAVAELLGPENVNLLGPMRRPTKPSPLQPTEPPPETDLPVPNEQFEDELTEVV